MFGKLTRFFTTKATKPVNSLELYPPNRGVKWFNFLAGTKIDFKSRAGDVYDNGAVFPALSWYWRNMNSARLIVQEQIKTPSGRLVWVEKPGHDLPYVFKNSDQQDETYLWFGILLSFWIPGEVFLYKLRNVFGQVIGFRWLPNHWVTPMNDKFNDAGTKSISYYEVNVQTGQVFIVMPENIIHLRYGADPKNPGRGVSPLMAALREVVGDNIAATISVALMDNAGVAGIAMVPKQGVIEELTEQERVSFTDRWRDNTTGDNAGTPNLLPFPVDVVHIGYKPADLVLDKQREVAVGRILAAFGIDPMVLGFKSEQKTYSNFREALEAAWETSLIPVMEIIAKQLTRWALPDFEKDTRMIRVGWDTSEIRSLQEDVQKKWDRARQAWRDGMITRAEALRMVCLEWTEEDEVYIHDVQMRVSMAEKEAMRDLYDNSRRQLTQEEDGDVDEDPSTD